MTEDQDRKWMQVALDACRKGINAGQSPFGAAIVDAHGGEAQLVACGHNHVWDQTDATAHAEVVTIRAACRRRGDVHLSGCTIYSTTEPCPMCFTAIHWARIERIVFAARVADARSFGFNELQIANRVMKEVSGSNIEVTPDVLRDQALALYESWRQRGGRSY